MAPLEPLVVDLGPRGSGPPQDPGSHHADIVEAWAQGFNVGAIVLLILLLLCNYRRGVLLHKLILLELVLAIWHGFFIFFEGDAYGWILSGTAVPLYVSYSLHNIVSWLKIKPFLPRWGSRVMIISLILVQPYWIVETWANFETFNDLSDKHVFKTSRVFEPFLRDPWWIFTTVKLVMVIKRNYEYTFSGLVKASPRFGVMLLCMFLSIAFLITDVAVTLRVSSLQSGINPFWRLALVFKCASDTIFLDDFKSVLDQIAVSALKRIMSLPYVGSQAGRSQGGRRKSSVAHPGRVSHHEHNPGPSVSISANREEALQRQSSRRGFLATLTSRRRDSGEDGLIDEDSDEPRHIMAETTITVSDHERRRNSSRSAASPSGHYPNDRPGNYGWGEPPSDVPVEPKSTQGSIPMLPMRARTNTRPFS